MYPVDCFDLPACSLAVASTAVNYRMERTATTRMHTVPAGMQYGAMAALHYGISLYFGSGLFVYVYTTVGRDQGYPRMNAL